MEAISSLVIPACWAIFLIYWLISASRVKTTAEKQSLSSALAHRIPVGLGWFLFIAQRLPQPMNRVLIPHSHLTLFLGTTICVLGMLITLWARWMLAGNWSSDVTFKQGHELIRTGPYRFVRHPIYTGLLVMGLGTAIAVGQLRCWLGLVVVFIGFWIKLRQEERLLLHHFPEAYPVYCREVKALIPFIL